MGKSPGKWIKTMLFGKKKTRSQSIKERNASKAGNDKGYIVANGPPASTENSPVISEPVLVRTHSNVINTELEKGNSSSLVGNTSIISASSQDVENQQITEPVASNNLEKFREEQAATKAQAAFRGYLARKAFHALKGIIRLQALVRGHLVRRQAIVTLRTTLGIIKLQALVRGKKIRSSGPGFEVNAKFCQGKTTVFKVSNSRKGKLYTNAFVRTLLSSSLIVMPLQILYDQEEPNSVPSWMERWTFSSFWRTPSLPRKNLDTKTQAKKGGYAMETESGRPKRNIRRNSSSNTDVGSTTVTTELEKPKRNVRKVPASSDSVQDPPQSELEKVKRNLRKVTSAYAETSERIESATNTPRNIKKLVDCSSDILEQNIEDSAEKAKKDIPVTPQPKTDMAEKAKKDNMAVIPQPKPDTAEKAKKDIAVITQLKPDMEIASESKDEEVQIEQSIDTTPAVESNQFLSTSQEEKISLVNGDVSVKEEQICNETQKTSKRRASFSAKSEYAESGVQSTPTLPSYMQATESAKAKLRRENSPRFASDSVEKNGITRRHSLPSSTNGKVTSSSPRTQKILQASGKGGIRSDRSLLSSRDGNDKPIQVEWRR